MEEDVLEEIWIRLQFWCHRCGRRQMLPRCFLPMAAGAGKSPKDGKPSCGVLRAKLQRRRRRHPRRRCTASSIGRSQVQRVWWRNWLGPPSQSFHTKPLDPERAVEHQATPLTPVTMAQGHRGTKSVISQKEVNNFDKNSLPFLGFPEDVTNNFVEQSCSA